MKSNRFFNESWLKVLMEPSKWRIVSSLFPAEAPAITDERHRRWLKRNTDSHARREIMMCLEGECVFSHENTQYACTPGTIFLIDKNEKHDSFYPRQTNGVFHLWMCLVEGIVTNAVVSVNKGRYTPLNNVRKPVTRRLEAVRLLYSTWDELHGFSANDLPERYKHQKIHVALSAFLTELVGLGYKEPESDSDSSKHQKQVIDIIKAHIVDTGGRDLSLDQLAHTAGYSKYHFLRMFKKHTGHTIHSFINQQRIAVTRERLHSGYRKNEIAEELGFSSPAVFSRWYNQHFK